MPLSRMVAPYRTADAAGGTSGTALFIPDTNAIESIQAQLRKVVRKRGAFPTPDSVRKVLYLALQRVSQNWKRPIRDWAAALNHLAIVFEGRIST